MKFKSKLLAIALASLTSCVTIRPTGNIDIAYIPQRFDDHEKKNELMTEFDLGLKLKVDNLNDLSLIIGGRQRTLMDLGITLNGAYYPFYPSRQEWDFYGKIDYKNWEFYAMHMCSHGVLNEPQKWIIDKETGKSYIINYDLITKLGVKFKF